MNISLFWRVISLIGLLQEINAADKIERKLTKSYNLPPDPITGREVTDDLNLVLIAFCYLIRRLTVGLAYTSSEFELTIVLSFAHVIVSFVTISSILISKC